MINNFLHTKGEIEGIKVRTYKPRQCVQYALVAAIDGFYPCYNSTGLPTIYLKFGEVWKYGKTCIGEDKRYPDLKSRKLLFQIQFVGTEEQCLIVEKEKIYNYYLSPENIERASRTGTLPLIRPPGNKIDR